MERIGTGDLIRGFLLKASLYAAALGTVLFPLVFTVFGFFFGALAGAVAGLPLGLLDDPLLCWLAATYRGVEPPSRPRFRARAGTLCVAGTFLALLTDWALHGLTDPDGFAVFRAYLPILDLFFSDIYLQDDVPPDLMGLSVWVLAPTAMALAASWLIGRRTGGWYLDGMSNA